MKLINNDPTPDVLEENRDLKLALEDVAITMSVVAQKLHESMYFVGSLENQTTVRYRANLRKLLLIFSALIPEERVLDFMDHNPHLEDYFDTTYLGLSREDWINLRILAKKKKGDQLELGELIAMAKVETKKENKA